MSKPDEKNLPAPNPEPQKVEQFVEPKVDFAKDDSTQGAPEVKEPDANVEVKEGEDKPAPTFSDYLKERGVDTDEVAKSTKSAEEIRKEGEIRTSPAAVKVTDARILDDIDESDRPLFKSMSNEAFNKLKPVYLERKQLKANEAILLKQIEDSKKTNLPASWTSHPQAFKLAPEYTQLETNVDAATEVVRHWALQNARIRRGEQWQDATGFDKEGNLIVSEAKDSDANAEASVGAMLTFAQEQLFDAKKKLGGFVDSFSGKYKEDASIIDEAYKKYFPGYDAPNHATRKIQDQVMSLIPPSFRDVPITKLFLATVANNAILEGKLKAALKEIESLKGVKTDSNAGPKKGEFVNGNVSDKRVVNFDDFEKRKAGL